jgi:hypothetical protein
MSEPIGICKMGKSYRVTGGHLPSVFVTNKKQAESIAEARLKLLEYRINTYNKRGHKHG